MGLEFRRVLFRSEKKKNGGEGEKKKNTSLSRVFLAFLLGGCLMVRSEERRVGKDCIKRWVRKQ